MMVERGDNENGYGFSFDLTQGGGNDGRGNGQQNGGVDNFGGKRGSNPERDDKN